MKTTFCRKLDLTSNTVQRARYGGYLSRSSGNPLCYVLSANRAVSEQWWMSGGLKQVVEFKCLKHWKMFETFKDILAEYRINIHQLIIITF